MTQRDKVLQMLRMGPVCGTEFLGIFIPRYSARILELRQDGFVISKRPCKSTIHWHESLQFVYELENADQMRFQI